MGQADLFCLERRADPGTAAESSVLPNRGQLQPALGSVLQQLLFFQPANQAIKVSLGMSAKAEVRTLTEGSHT